MKSLKEVVKNITSMLYTGILTGAIFVAIVEFFKRVYLRVQPMGLVEYLIFFILWGTLIGSMIEILVSHLKSIK